MIHHGMFGPIEVRDGNYSGMGNARCVLLNGQVQGGALLYPPAIEVDASLPVSAPGPFSESVYALGWLLAGLNKPTGSGLMIGLGSGAGATQLLCTYPGIDLTIVEIDPVMTQVALDTYPCIPYYMDQGRLNIVVADAREFLRRRYDKWHFGLADAFTGHSSLVTDYLALLCDRTDDVYLNVIDRFGGPVMKHVWDTLEARKKPVQQIFRALPLPCLDAPPSLRMSTNWIMTSADVDIDQALEHPPAGQEELWYSFLAHAVMQPAQVEQACQL